jgi:hypothetical protein
MTDVGGPWQTDGAAVVMPVAPCFFVFVFVLVLWFGPAISSRTLHKKIGAP